MKRHQLLYEYSYIYSNTPHILHRPYIIHTSHGYGIVNKYFDMNHNIFFTSIFGIQLKINKK